MSRTPTYFQLSKQISKLQAEANLVRDKEKAGVVVRIKEAIDAYGLSASDLFGGGAANAKGNAKFKAKGGQAKTAKANGSTGPKFGDGSGNVWGGRGPRPQWLRAALGAGKQLSDFELSANGAGNQVDIAAPRDATSDAPKTPGPKVPSKAAPKKSAKSASQKLPPKYKDDAGNSWTGRGTRPGWFKNALASGKKPEELLA